MEPMAKGLVGRAPEELRIAALVSGKGPERLLLSGPPGIGKTALLRLTGQVATDHGLRILRASGLEAERYIPFAALHQLLLPLLGRLSELPELPQLALARAFALVPSTQAPDPLHVGLGALADQAFRREGDTAAARRSAVDGRCEPIGRPVRLAPH